MPERREDATQPVIDYAALQRFVQRQQQADAPLSREEYDGYDRWAGRPEPESHSGALFKPFRY